MYKQISNAVALILCAMSFSSSADTIIKLPPVIYVNADEVKIEDIYKVKVGDTAVNELTVSVVNEGVDRFINKKDIELAVVKRPEKVIVVGPERVEVRLYKTLIQSEQITKSAEDYFNKQLRELYPSATIKRVSNVNDVRLLENSDNAVLVSRWEEVGHLRKRECVMVDIKTTDGVVKSVPVWFEVSAPDMVYVLKKAVVKNALLEESLVEERVVDIAALSSKPINPNGMYDDYVFVSDQAESAVLTMASIRKRPDVLSGDEVKVISAIGAVKIETVARAVKDANKGETVTLQNLNAGDQFAGKVIDRNLVVVSGAEVK